MMPPKSNRENASQPEEHHSSTAIPTVREALINTTIGQIAQFGINAVSLRSVAKEIGVTTAAIVHYFGNKNGLLVASAQHALSRDRQIHDEYLTSLSTLPMNGQIFADLIPTYLELQRQNFINSRFWLEVLYHSQAYPVLLSTLQLWHGLREQFWQEVMRFGGISHVENTRFTSYIFAEEVFSCALHGHLTYGFLLKETARTIAAAIFQTEQILRYEAPVTDWLKSQTLRFPIVTEPDESSLRERLLSHAAAAIRQKGTGTINQRHLAKLAHASPSMIVYHFGDMNTFAQEAIWRALLHRLPPEFDPAKSRINQQEDRAHWAKRLASMISPSNTQSRHAGFYVGYSRLTGQTALLASHQAELVPLIYQLRCLEGFGTYRLRRVIWPDHPIPIGYIQAAAFGMWIKGEAVLNEAIRPDHPTSAEDILSVANAIGQ